MSKFEVTGCEMLSEKMQICTDTCHVTVNASLITIGSMFKLLFKEVLLS